MLAVAVAAITSCTKSEVVDIPESRLIGFDPFVGKQTRTDETTTGEDGTNRHVITGRNDLTYLISSLAGCAHYTAIR